MEIAGFLTFLGLLIAAYSILKSHERLYIRLRLSLLDKVVIPIFAVIIFLLIILSDHIKDYDKEIVFLKFNLKLSFLISASAYIFLLLISVYIIIKINFNRLKRNKINLFYKLTKELLNKKEYPSLIEILDDEYGRLIKYCSKLSWNNNIKGKLLSFFCIKSEFKLSVEDAERLRETLKEIGEEHEIENKELTKKERIRELPRNISVNLRHYVGKLLRCFYSEVRDKSSERSKYLLHSLLSNSEFMSEMIVLRPELGLKIFEKEFPGYFEYVDIFFYELMKNNKSILYYEVRNNQNMRDYHRYAIQEGNVILSYLFRDCRVAQRLEVYRGVEDYFLDYLLDLNKLDIDLYNYAYGNFENKKWESPIFMGIRFFDIMVSEAIYQGIRDHMWLYYFRHFTESILNNFKYIPKVWEEPHEWNTGYAYLLYEVVHTLRNWVEIIREQRFRYPVELQKDDHSHENANVIKSSIICLIQVLELIAGNENVPEKFKQEQADIVIKLLFELRTSDSETAMRYSNALFDCIKFYMEFPMRLNKQFYELLKYTYKKFDNTHFTIGDKKEKGSQLDKEIKEYLDSISI